MPLHSAALGAAIASIVLTEDVKLTREQSFIAKVTGFPLAPLPVHGEKECALFLRLVLQGESRTNKPDFEQLAIDWCKFVKPSDGIFPKLPVYLRLHYATHERNTRARNAELAVDDAGAALEQLNRATMPAAQPVSASAAVATPPAAPALAVATEATAALARLAPRLPITPIPHPFGAQPIQPIACATNYALSGGAARPAAVIDGPQWQASPSYGTVALLPHAPAAMRATAVPLLVGDRFVGAQLHAAGERQQPSGDARAVGQRGQDARPRKPRTCKSCEQSKEACRGAVHGAESCEHAT